MFNSVKKWINVPFQYKSFVKHNGAGTKIYSDTVDSLCYPVGNIKTVVDYEGEEVTSTTTLYVDGDNAIKPSDKVIFEGFERRILRMNTFYRDGVPDIKVVYL